MTHTYHMADVAPPHPIVLLRWQRGRLVQEEFAASAIQPDGVAVAIEALRLDRMAWVAPGDVEQVRAGLDADPLVVTQANAFRAALLRREATQLRAMTARWLTVERSLQAGIADMLGEIDVLRAGGRVFGRNPDPYLQLERYRALLRQTQREIARFNTVTERTIVQGIFDFAGLGATHATTAVETAVGDALLGGFNRLNIAAVENIVGVLQDAAPVGELLGQAFPEAAVRMTDALINGTALGWNPTKTVAAMVQGLQSATLQRAMVIARTEQLRAYRTATIESYRASDVVRGWKWVAVTAPAHVWPAFWPMARCTGWTKP